MFARASASMTISRQDILFSMLFRTKLRFCHIILRRATPGLPDSGPVNFLWQNTVEIIMTHGLRTLMSSSYFPFSFFLYSVHVLAYLAELLFASYISRCYTTYDHTYINVDALVLLSYSVIITSVCN